jgi:NADH dehydrogenase FAD-containing subunit
MNIVIIGGGFAGLTWPKNFKPKGDSGNLVDKNNYNFFPPLIYQVATAFWNHPVSVILVNLQERTYSFVLKTPKSSTIRK